MQRSILSWTILGSLLIGVAALGQVSSGCIAFDPIVEASNDLDSENGGSGGQSNGATSTAGTGSSSTTSGGGGQEVSHPDQIFDELDNDKGFSPKGTKEKPIEIYSGTVTTIRGRGLNDYVDDDDLYLISMDDAVLRFDAFSANKDDPGCNNLHVGLSWFDQSPVKLSDPGSAGVGDDNQIGIGILGEPANCSAMTYYLTSGAVHGLRITSSSFNGFSDSDYYITIRSIPVKTEDEINRDAPLIADNDLEGKDEFSVAISGLASRRIQDSYKINLTDKAVRIEIIEGLLGSEYSCEGGDFDFDLTVLPVTEPPTFSSNSGRGVCPMLDGFGPNPKAPWLKNVNGERTIQVSPLNSSVTPYTLVVSARRN